MGYKIYAVADIHGKPDRLEAIRRNIERHRPDLLILAGDITQYTRVGYTVDYLAQLSVPLGYVRGNTDRRHVDIWMKSILEARDLHLKRESFGGMDIVGVSGTFLLPFRSRIGFREARMVRALASLLTPGSILVCHPPPLGICDRVAGRFSAGSSAIARLVQTCRPGVVLCGHIHEASGTGFLEGTRIVNCAMGGGREGAILEFSGDGGSTLIWPARESPG